MVPVMNLDVVATSPGGPLHEIGGVTYELPPRFDVVVTEADRLEGYVVRFGVVATLAGPKVEWVRVEQHQDDRGRPLGPYVTTTALRHLKLDQWVEAAIPKAVTRAVVVEDEDGRSGTLHAVDDQQREEFRRGWRKGGRRTLSDDVLRRVATTYRSAIAVGLPPTQAVAGEFGITRANAGQWVHVARQRGHLRPSPGPRMAGEVPEEGEQP